MKISPTQEISYGCLRGEKPDPEDAKLLDKDLVLHAEHGSNASSFTARVVVGTRANLHAAITAAIAALSGPAHGGAAEDVMKMARDIGNADNVQNYIKQMRKNRTPVTGFGPQGIPSRRPTRTTCPIRCGKTLTKTRRPKMVPNTHAN